MSSPSAAHDTIGLNPQLREARALHCPAAVGERSCCCPSRPAMRIVLAATPDRDHPVDLLLCRHHYRRNLAVLAAAGARIFDISG